MKIGTIVLAGAAGLALAGAAQADRFVASTPLVSINGTGALNVERTWSAAPEGTSLIAERPRVYRDHRRMQAAMAEIALRILVAQHSVEEQVLLLVVPVPHTPKRFQQRMVRHAPTPA